MKEIVLNVDKVLPDLLQTCSLVATKPTIPILGDVIIKSFRDKDDNLALMFITSNSEIWMVKRSVVEDGCDDFAVAVNAHDLARTLKTLTGCTVTLKIDDSPVMTGVYQNGHFQLPVDNWNEFPECASENENEFSAKMNPALLCDGINLTKMAANKDDLRPILGGIHFNFDENRTSFVACGFALMAKFDCIMESHQQPNNVTIPIDAAKALVALIANTDDDVKLSFGEHVAVFSNQSFKLIARLACGKYANYQTLMNKMPNTTLTVDRNGLINSVKRVMPLGDTETKRVKFSIKENSLTVSADNFDFSKSAEVKLECEYSGEDFEMCINGNILLECLANMKFEEITWRVNGAQSPVFITSNETDANTELMYVVMPMVAV